MLKGYMADGLMYYWILYEVFHEFLGREKVLCDKYPQNIILWYITCKTWLWGSKINTNTITNRKLRLFVISAYLCS